MRLFQEHKVKSSPFIEADLIWSSFGRLAQDYSPKTSEVFDYGSNLPVYYWKLIWGFPITIYNNSKYHAYNIKIDSIGEKEFDSIDKLERINNLPPFQKIDLEAKYTEYYEGTSIELDNLFSTKIIPEAITGAILKISYFDESRENELVTVSEIVTDNFINSRK